MPMNVTKMRKVQFAELIEFVAVAEDRSFSRAAARLGVSTATLSHTIRAASRRDLVKHHWAARKTKPGPPRLSLKRRAPTAN
jgi:hypothetical protein